MAAPATYSKIQIFLHWLIAALVIFQIVFHESIAEQWEARMEGVVPNEPVPNLHALFGMLIFLLVLARLWFRLARGVPAAPESEHPALRLAASATHALFYLLLFAMPISGTFAWFLGFELPAELHEMAAKILIPLVALHVLAALAHHFWFKTNVLKRMLGKA